MAQYTIEDIDILRKKSGISYEEAVNLLEYHNGSLARALVDLERNGKLRADAQPDEPTSRHRGVNVLNFLYRTRVKTTRGDATVVNLSLMFLLFVLLLAPWVLIIGAVVALVLGYHFSVERNSRAFSDESFDHMVKNAGSNVKNTVYEIARDLGVTGKSADAKPDDAPKGSYYDASQTSNDPAPASGTTPVNVRFSEDGNVHVKEDDDGYHEADIQ